MWDFCPLLKTSMFKGLRSKGNRNRVSMFLMDFSFDILRWCCAPKSTDLVFETDLEWSFKYTWLSRRLIFHHSFLFSNAGQTFCVCGRVTVPHARGQSAPTILMCQNISQAQIGLCWTNLFSAISVSPFLWCWENLQEMCIMYGIAWVKVSFWVFLGFTTFRCVFVSFCHNS